MVTIIRRKKRIKNTKRKNKEGEECYCSDDDDDDDVDDDDAGEHCVNSAEPIGVELVVPATTSIVASFWLAVSAARTNPSNIISQPLDPSASTTSAAVPLSPVTACNAISCD